MIWNWDLMIYRHCLAFEFPFELANDGDILHSGSEFLQRLLGMYHLSKDYFDTLETLQGEDERERKVSLTTHKLKQYSDFLDANLTLTHEIKET
jgi:hypothetical protein